MRGQARIRPGKAVSALGAVVGLGMLVLVLSSGILRDAPGGFGAFFVLLIVVGIGMSIFNAVSRQGIAENLIDFNPTSGADESDGGGDFETRLEKLDQLRTDGLITSEEYETQRRKIIESV